jgi:aldose 1-epimerase
MLTLRAGESSLVLAPEIGGAVVGWTLGATPLLRRAIPDAIITSNVHGLGCFPLVPFSNRIAHGVFRWNGGEHRLDRNFGDHPHTIHGVGWQTGWTPTAISTTSVTLAMQHDALGEQTRRWPFAFAAEQRFTLMPDALHVTLTMRNLHGAPAPAGLGLHPYFPRRGAPTLRFNATQVWLTDANSLPLQRVSVPSEWDHGGSLRVGAVPLDNCFSGWDGEAQIAWEADNRTLTITGGGLFRHLIVYTPPGQDFFCVEPVSHLTDAINRMSEVPDHGLKILAPGEAVLGEITFRIATIA